MISTLHTDSSHPDFILLVRELDADLAEKNGDQHAFYNQFNSVAAIRHVVVAYDDDKPVGCGAIKEFSPGIMEVKRMYTRPGNRRKGIAATVLQALENRAAELGATQCVLETGKKQPEAINLYTKKGYRSIPNYGQYAGVENSLCFAREVG